jgi:hypothetical protein
MTPAGSNVYSIVMDDGYRPQRGRMFFFGWVVFFGGTGLDLPEGSGLTPIGLHPMLVYVALSGLYIGFLTNFLGFVGFKFSPFNHSLI